jgi:type I restriction enzyme M protein
LTDNSSEIECLFVERTKQLLKDGGVGGVILPSSILNNAGIYTKTREMILQFFDIVAIAELGSNTFMATSTNTVVLFLRRRNNYDNKNIRDTVDGYFRTFNDVTINGVETPVAKYVAHVWEGLDYADYLTLLQKTPNDKIKAHEIYADYRKKIRAKDDAKFWNEVLALESEKLTYFIIAYPQKVVLVKSGEKDAEKRFLGYEFSNRRGSEGIHPIQRGKNIEECTQLFDVHNYDNPDKASTYIYRAFKGDLESEIAESMQDNVSRTRLVDMLTFDRADFEKTISTTIKKKAKIESKWNVVKVSDFVEIIGGGTPDTNNPDYWNGNIPWLSVVDFNNGNRFVSRTEKSITEKGLKNSSAKYINVGDLIISARGTVGALAQLSIPMTFNQSCYGLRGNEKLDNGFLYYILKAEIEQLKNGSYGSIFKAITTKTFDDIIIPLPPTEIQLKIVADIEVLEQKETIAREKIEELNNNIDTLLSNVVGEETALNKIAPYVGDTIKTEEISLDTYITTDNMLQNKLGITPFVGTPNISSITKYKTNDILISNIRPYLKKIWFADKDGGCSKDVLVFRSSDSSLYSPKFIYYMIRRDAFFDYVMEGKKGVKMPRGDKNKIMKYIVNIPTPKEQHRIVSEIEALEKEIAYAQGVIDGIPEQKTAILKKHL